MENFNFVRDCMTKLPPGFRFQPTDEELTFRYLKCKVFSSPLPASIIPDINVCKYDPWNLPGEFEQERYFFSNKETKYRNGNRINRATASGYWKATGVDKKIVSSRSNQMVGMRKTLVFHRGKPRHGSRTYWFMHEYRLVTPPLNFPHTNNSVQNHSNQIGDWVLCHIFLKKRSVQNEEETFQAYKNDKNNEAAISEPGFFDLIRRERSNVGPLPSSCSSSCSSTITEEVCSCVSDHEESNSFNVL
ncbi:hypothetical protein SLEP1_g27905 [Rubroshorea leprosula]|uniref:NAC domain-containing protein n=1 Tax=Rubroshorea leprosula TaxID=152421 RepID=A0AAV5JYZ7_9ROSI|nr:hypothetical protein SLEP1_g27905 [Rubroshorea leprosula]